MDSNYQGYRPTSPDLNNDSPRPQSPDLNGPASFTGGFNQQSHQPFHGGRFGGAFGGSNYGAQMNYASPTSIPQQQYQNVQPHQQLGNMESPLQMKREDEEWLPDAPRSKRARKDGLQRASAANGGAWGQQGAEVKTELGDPTLGVDLKTSFPVARIKRIMQADEDIGKVAQVTPHVVSRALELFMIKLIAASAQQARGGNMGENSGKASAKKVAPQHLKKAVMANEEFDFLHDIVNKVPDAPSKAKKEVGSESDEEKKAPKRRGKRRKDSEDI